ncbi:MAG: hypothetical protein F6K58_14560 [Symploca sp. SIO2E9]|nr:hypothetical protein [Symploca sp. SIO2E9]
MSCSAEIIAVYKFIYTEILEVPEKNRENNSSSTSNFENSKTLESNRKLVKLLKDAYEAKAGEDGWANLGLLGNQLNQFSSSFDPRNFGYKKLGDLFGNVDLFEVKEIPHKKDPLVKELLVKLK